MADDLVLQHPHVHEWLHHNDHRVYLGQVDDHSPAIFCACGVAAGRWDQVPINVRVESNYDVVAEDLWPDGKVPMPLTVEAVARRLIEKPGLINDWLWMDSGDVSIAVGRQHASLDEVRRRSA